jgi:hypothetical protein
MARSASSEARYVSCLKPTTINSDISPPVSRHHDPVRRAASCATSLSRDPASGANGTDNRTVDADRNAALERCRIGERQGCHPTFNEHHTKTAPGCFSFGGGNDLSSRGERQYFLVKLNARVTPRMGQVRIQAGQRRFGSRDCELGSEQAGDRDHHHDG